jgi:hypothetical protein
MKTSFEAFNRWVFSDKLLKVVSLRAGLGAASYCRGREKGEARPDVTDSYPFGHCMLHDTRTP